MEKEIERIMTSQEQIIQALKSKFDTLNLTFYQNIWEKRVYNWLLEDDKYSKLADWCSREIEVLGDISSVFSPINKSDKYSMDDFKTYKDSIGNLAIIVHLRSILVSAKCSDQERKNIEYALCKIFNIAYSDTANEYIQRGADNDKKQ